MKAKKTTVTDEATLIEELEELSDEELTSCVGGNLCSTSISDLGEEMQLIWPRGGWPSDRNIKEDFAAVDVQQILAKVAQLPILTWKYKQQASQHIGPMAQDFAAAFNVGDSDRHINGVDANGVALAAIQALYYMLLEKEATITTLRADLDDLKQQVTQNKQPVAMPAATFSCN